MARELMFRVTIKDCQVETFRAGGKGGQNQNKRDTGVRVKHAPSGAVGEARDSRSQLLNKRSAFRRMGESQIFQVWARTTALGRESIEQRVDRLMAQENLIIESYDPRPTR